MQCSTTQASSCVFFKEPALSSTWSVLGAHTDDIFSYLGLPKLKWYKLRNPGVAACV